VIATRFIWLSVMWSELVSEIVFACPRSNLQDGCRNPTVREGAILAGSKVRKDLSPRVLMHPP